MSKPASDTEEEKINHAISALKNAMDQCKNIPSTAYTIFVQGSYANNTNVRTESDVDLNICYTDAFYYNIPEGSTKESYGFTNPVDYSAQAFKDDIEKVLVDYFGRSSVTRNNKCLHVSSNTYRVEMDVVPTWRYRRYKSRWNYDEGVKFYADNWTAVINFPKQHIENGKTKNSQTSKRYKSLARIIKKLNIEMKESGYYDNPNITSFLLECLAYNLPNTKYMINNILDWNIILQNMIYYCWNSTKEDNKTWERWTEVSCQLYLMNGHKWNRKDVNEFMFYLWNYLEYGKG